MSFRRITDIPFDAYMAALDSWQLTGHRGELRLGNSLLRGAGRARSTLRYHADRGALGPRAAAPAGADTARDRALVAHRHRPRTHPVPTGEAERILLRGRPPPAGLPDPPATGAHGGAAAPRSGKSARRRQLGRPGSQPPIVGRYGGRSDRRAAWPLYAARQIQARERCSLRRSCVPHGPRRVPRDLTQSREIGGTGPGGRRIVSGWWR